MSEDTTLFVCENIGMDTESEVEITKKDGRFQAHQEVSLFGMGGCHFFGYGSTPEEARTDLEKNLKETSEDMWR